MGAWSKDTSAALGFDFRGKYAGRPREAENTCKNFK